MVGAAAVAHGDDAVVPDTAVKLVGNTGNQRGFAFACALREWCQEGLCPLQVAGDCRLRPDDNVATELRPGEFLELCQDRLVPGRVPFVLLWDIGLYQRNAEWFLAGAGNPYSGLQCCSAAPQ